MVHFVHDHQAALPFWSATPAIRGPLEKEIEPVADFLEPIFNCIIGCDMSLVHRDAKQPNGRPLSPDNGEGPR